MSRLVALIVGASCGALLAAVVIAVAEWSIRKSTAALRAIDEVFNTDFDTSELDCDA